EFPGDRFRAPMLEYLVSGPAKDYESLLVVSAAEQARVQALRALFQKRAGEGWREAWSAQLLWVEGGSPRALDLRDLLSGLAPKVRGQFLDHLGVNRNGLGGTTNVRADAGLLPRTRVPARLLLTIRMPPQG